MALLAHVHLAIQIHDHGVTDDERPYMVMELLTGEPLDDASVRAILLLRARTLAAGYSGVRPELPRRLLQLLDLGLLPVVPGKGSVGASGDLAPLAHMSAVLLGIGQVVWSNTRQIRP